MSAIETLRAYRTLHNAENVDDAIAEIERSYERLDEQADEIDRLRADLTTWKKAHIELGEMHDRLRAELAMYKTDGAMVRELNRLRAENEALRKQLMNNSPGTASDGGKQSD